MQLFEYIADNYIWFFGGIILILLAIIGYYADKTNFGLGKTVDADNNKENNDLNDIGLQDADNNNDVIAETNGEINLENNQGFNSELDKDGYNEGLDSFAVPSTLNITNMPNDDLNNSETKISENNNDLNGLETNISENNDNYLIEDSFSKFDEEFNLVLPKKSFMNSDLLDDIDDLDLGKTQKFDLNDITNMGDIELPKIKQLDDEEQDIWKF